MDGHQRVVLEQGVRPGARAAGRVPATVRKGLAGPAMSPKKKAATAYMTRVAQPHHRVGRRRR